MSKIEIKNRWTGAVIWSGEADSMRSAVETAVRDHADLSAADLRDANLSDADLRAADLRDANLSDADLRDANLSDADLRAIRDDVAKILTAASSEVTGLLLALREGRINGSVYHGECACLVGTIANVRGCSLSDLESIGIETDPYRPAEKWFMALQPGHTPENNAVARITEEWIVDWLREKGRDVPPFARVSWTGDVKAFAAAALDAGIDMGALRAAIDS